MSSDPGTFIPYGRQTISDGDIAAVVQVLRSPYLTQGPTVPAFEEAVAAMVGARHGVAANSATSFGLDWSCPVGLEREQRWPERFVPVAADPGVLVADGSSPHE